MSLQSGTCDPCSMAGLVCLIDTEKGRACVECRRKKQSCTVQGERLNRVHTRSQSENASPVSGSRRLVQRRRVREVSEPTTEMSEGSAAGEDTLAHEMYGRVVQLEKSLRREQNIRLGLEADLCLERKARKQMEEWMRKVESLTIRLVEAELVRPAGMVSLNPEGKVGVGGSKGKGKGKEKEKEKEREKEQEQEGTGRRAEGEEKQE